MLIYDIILEGPEVPEDEIEKLKYLAVVCHIWEWDEIIENESEIKYKKYIDNFNGIDVYYEYGADYYFFVSNPNNN